MIDSIRMSFSVRIWISIAFLSSVISLFEPWKSKRLMISLRAILIALSSNCASTLFTISNEAICGLICNLLLFYFSDHAACTASAIFFNRIKWEMKQFTIVFKLPYLFSMQRFECLLAQNN